MVESTLDEVAVLAMNAVEEIEVGAIVFGALGFFHAFHHICRLLVEQARLVLRERASDV